MKNTNVFKESIKLAKIDAEENGENLSLQLVQEECSELIKECSKVVRGAPNLINLECEIGDVMFMCFQLMEHMSITPDRVNKLIVSKQELKHPERLEKMNEMDS